MSKVQAVSHVVGQGDGLSDLPRELAAQFESGVDAALPSLVEKIKSAVGLGQKTVINININVTINSAKGGGATIVGPGATHIERVEIDLHKS